MSIRFSHWKHVEFRMLLSTVALLASTTFVAFSAHANGLARSNYRSFSGDVNGDGRTDILLKAVSTTVLIPLDDLTFPVIVKPENPSFSIISNASGAYSLIANPDEGTLNSTTWQAGSYGLVYGDVLGNGLGSVLIKASATNAPSFVVAITASSGIQLLQTLTPATLGIDLGTSGATVELRKYNADNRSDLIVNMDGRIAAVFTANEAGLFQRNDELSVQAVWSGLLTAFSNGDVDTAAQYFVEESRDQYREYLADLGEDIKKIPGALSPIRQLSKTDSYAEYVMQQTIGGQSSMYIVPFLRRDGLWSISGF
jgi:hypothetical protein